jgi:hypothetical protein
MQDDAECHVFALTNANGITVVGKDLLHTQVTDDNVGFLLDQAKVG